jgi:LemA protein
VPKAPKRRYNESVNTNNIAIEVFPDLMMARLFDFRTFDLLRFERGEIQDVDVRVLFQMTGSR